MNIDQLREKTRKIKQHPIHSKWDAHRQAIRNHILRENPEEFTRWSTVQATMYKGWDSKTRNRFIALRNLREIECAMEVDGEIGAFNKILDGLCPNKIRQMYYIQLLQDELKIDVSKLDSIAEFGGGYGAMCNVIRRLGFDGKYHLYDFPELLLLQEYYLSNCGYGNQTYNQTYNSKNADLLIALTSLSETPVKQREDFLRKVKSKMYCIVYQKEFDGVDNQKWFTNWATNNLRNFDIFQDSVQLTHMILVGR